MPINTGVPNRPLKAPAGPPPLNNGRSLPIPPPPPPMRFKLPPRPVEPEPSFLSRMVGWIILSVGVVLFSLAMAKVFEIQARDVKAWAKDFDYRHCMGKYDTPACHEPKEKAKAEAYKNYKE